MASGITSVSSLRSDGRSDEKYRGFIDDLPFVVAYGDVGESRCWSKLMTSEFRSH